MRTLLLPLISLFDRLRFPVKFGLVIALFMAPILVLGDMALTVANQKIATNAVQAAGLHYLRPLRKIAVHTAQHRGMTNASLCGANGFESKLLAKRSEIAKDYEELRLESEDLPPNPEFAAQAKTLQQRWQTLAPRSGSMSAPESFAAHSALIAAYLSYMQHMADATELSTETELDIHYLNVALVDRLPAQVEIIGQTRGYGSGRAAAQTLTPEQRLHLTKLVAEIQSTMEHLDTGLKIAFSGRPIIEKELSGLAQKASQSTASFVKLSNNDLITAKRIVVDPGTYFDAGSQAIAANLALYDKMIEVDHLILSQRLHRASINQKVTIGGIAGIFLVLLYVFAALYTSLRDNIALLDASVARLAEGNFQSQPTMRAQDELATIATSLNFLRLRVAQRVAGVLNSAGLLVDQATMMMGVNKQERSNATQQKGEINNVTRSVSQMTSAIADVADTTNDAARTAHKANESAADGTEAVQAMIENIQGLSADIHGAGHVIQKLEQDSQDISQILNVIREIANQTNLLALNAAIEAARAGHHGRGFAVVADEVRVLAQSTQEATLEIQQTIEQLQAGSREATEVISKSRDSSEHSLQQASDTGAVFDTIAQHVLHIDTVTSQIATATEQQSNMAGEINGNVNSINRSADDIASVSFQSFVASNTVASLAVEVQTLLQTFAIDDTEIQATQTTDLPQLFPWLPEYCIGVSEVDRQHKMLVNLINELHQGITEKRGDQTITRSLEALVNYTVSHFVFEEEMFEQTQYPDITNHKRAHAKLLGQLSDFGKRVAHGVDEALYQELLGFLKDWLVRHIQGSDKQYAPHLNQHGIH